MSNQTNGLRFDVYERVHLPDDVLGIDELEEIELVPRIQVLQQGEQVLLKGHLLLSGVYRAQNERGDAQALEHWIPVEITLPLNRINRLDDISVEIDNFDVDLLSARTLNITGVLSLLGIGIESSEPAANWPEEPFTVVHERSEQEAEPVEASSNDYYANWVASEQGRRFQEAQQAIEVETAERERLAAEQLEREVQLAREQEATLWRQQEEAEQAQRAEELRWQQLQEEEAARLAQETARQQEEEAARQREQEEQERLAREAISREIELAAERERAAWQAQEPDSEPAAPSLEAAPDSPAEPASSESPFSSYLTLEEEAVELREQDEPQPSTGQPVASFTIADQTVEQDNSRKELKVAVSGKAAQEQAEHAAVGSGLGFRTLLHSSQREQEAKAIAEQNARRAAEEAKRSAGDEIEWQRLFLNRPAEGNEFKKMRIAIVQKEETLDTIAGRYQLQAREIALYNRLHDQNVSEGQVLYIP